MPLYNAITKKISYAFLHPYMHAKPCTVLLPCVQRAFCSSQSQPKGNPLRCMESLKQEHFRIKRTMQSFDRMLDALDADIDAKNVGPERLKDMQKFLTFCQLYSYHHDSKEEILFAYAQRQHDKPALQKLCNEHNHNREMYTLIDETRRRLPRTTSSEELVTPSKKFIAIQYAHIQQEDEEVYPQLEQQFDEADMELLSCKTDEFDAQNAISINAMQFLSDELNEKYS